MALAAGLARRGDFAVTVLHFYPGPFQEELREAGVKTVCIGKKHRWDLAGFLIRLIRAMRAAQPQVIHSYLNEANLMAVLLKPFCGRPRIVWGLRDSQTDAHQWGLLGRLSFRLNIWLSGCADLIIANSRAGRDYYIARGYPAARMEVVPNGIDAAKFSPANGEHRGHGVFGSIGRLNPMKDHATFLQAAAVAVRARPDLRFIIAGEGDETYTRQLHALAENLGLTEKITWSGARQDMPAVYGTLDAVVSSSAFGEGFSNVLGEAMACGLPCIATDVGDSAWLINDPSRICPPGNAAALAHCMIALAALAPEARDGLGARSRQRICDHFTVERMIARTAELLGQVTARRITFITTGLGTGGAEMMLWQILTRLDRKRFKTSVIALTTGGKYAALLQEAGVQVESLDLPPGRFTFGAVLRLFRSIRRCRPEIMVGWMYHGCLAALLAKLLLLRPIPVIWSIRQSLYSLDLEKPGSARVIRALAPLSRFAKVILYNSKVSAQQHEALGYCAAKRHLVPNGFDLERWKPRATASPLPEPLGQLVEVNFIGRFGRHAVMKDYPTFLQAAALIVQEAPQTHFILAGPQVDAANEDLTAQIARLGITERVHLLGERDDLPALTAALDIAVSSSAFGEGFPNVVGEAMACTVSVVATDIGDTAWVLGDAGKLVPPKDPQALAGACLELLRLSAAERRAVGARGRRRIEDHFSLRASVQQLEGLLA
ncbi:MAG: glycosyltransferase [Prosthecobacter sp.]|nr:glycosyltransferase [Prosthecobacter sp.]